MTGNRTTGTGTAAGPGPGTQPPRRPPPFGSERPIRRPTPEEIDRRGDEIFQQSIADLSRRLAAQAAQQATADPRAEAEKRRAALLAYNLARKRRLKMAGGAGGLALAAGCVAWFVVSIGTSSPEDTASASAAPAATRIETASLAPSPATSAPAPAAAPSAPAASSPPTVPPAAAVPSTAAAPSMSAAPDPSPAPSASAAPSTTGAPATLPPALPSPATPAPSAAAPPPSQPADAPSSAPAAVATQSPPLPARAAPRPPSPPPGVVSARAEADAGVAARGQASPDTASDSAPAPDGAPLQRAEIREVQTKLYTFGFNPGPIDGAPGPMTDSAAKQYRVDRGLPQTGAVDRALLEQLRQDPTPPVAQAPPPVRRHATRAYVQRNDPFEPLRQAGDRFSRWLQSLGR
ncbi:peptidoglycan-binding domain-containing protein [Reyranella sp.]|uniref:peptidoglycan-binding domain-containing protein n=1 Tax=Reyranella sp. TaxID=1929291 RepID=UPI002F927A7C